MRTFVHVLPYGGILQASFIDTRLSAGEKRLQSRRKTFRFNFYADIRLGINGTILY